MPLLDIQHDLDQRINHFSRDISPLLPRQGYDTEYLHSNRLTGIAKCFRIIYLTCFKIMSEQFVELNTLLTHETVITMRYYHARANTIC